MGTGSPRGNGIAALFCCAVAGLLLALVRPATAFDDDDPWGGWDDYYWVQMEMQRQAISSQEEQAREAGRQRRRDEIAKDQEKKGAEHEAYFEAILESSQASLRAPQGVFYRRPGYVSVEPPGRDAEQLEIGGIDYIYDQGIFWMQQGTQYIAVPAPFGAVVRRLPTGATRLPSRKGAYSYFFGTFFGERNGGFEVVKPPPGVVVTYVPDGYVQEQVKGATVYRFGDIIFKPVFVQGILAYQVVEF